MTGPRHATGFTLVEVLIVMAVIAVLAAIAIPSYVDHIERGHRTEAKARLLEAAQWMERFRAEGNGTYEDATLPSGLLTSPASGKVVYDLSVEAFDTTYVLSAKPRAGTRAAEAGRCGTLTWSQDGRRTAGGDGSPEALARCWER